MKRAKVLVLSIAISLGVFAAPAQVQDGLKERFIRYAGIQSVSGREAHFIDFLKSQLPAGAKSETDNRGNLTVQFGEGQPELMVMTSVDEPGYVVTDITDEGFLRVSSPGGRAPNSLFAQFHEGHFVDIASRGGVVRGVVALPSSHLVRGRRESLTLDRLLIDIGARSRAEAEARGIEMLEPVTAVKDIALLAENRVAGPMLSRKFGAFAVMEALKGLATKSGKSVVFAWATQSAMSNTGAARLAKRFTPKCVVAVGAFQRAARGGKDPIEVLDSGVLLPDAESPGAAGAFLRTLLLAAESKVKIARSPAGAVAEARAFGSGADILPVAIPVLFPGTLVETIDIDDLQQLIAFLKLVLESSNFESGTL